MTKRPQIIGNIRRVRSRNNDLWMEILDIAMEAAPERTKDVIKRIRNNDRQITELLDHLIHDQPKPK